ncbi:MAG: hypothetical protein KDD61_13405 [Bdellovibrionales bacterium]|nr:hypothetical protein [Bdellovibrionales bacterium]
MKKELIILSIIPLLLTGCFGGDDADPLEGRQPPTVQQTPPPETTPDGKVVACSTLRQQDYEKYQANIELHKQEYQTSIKSLKDKSDQEIESQKIACEQSTLKIQQEMQAEKSQCQETINKYASEIESYRQGLVKDKQSVLQENALLKKQVDACVEAKKVTDRQSFTGMLYNLNISDAKPESLEFTEGIASSYEIHVRLFVGSIGVVKSLKANSNLPQGLKIVSSGKPGYWNIQWKPPYNLEAGNEAIYRTIELEPVIDTSKLSSRDAQLVAKEDLTRKIMLVVQRTKVKPQIEVSEFPQSVKRGDSMNFAVRVNDPASSEIHPPNVHIGSGELGRTSYRSTLNGASLVVADASRPPVFKNNTWTYYYSLNTGIIDLIPDLKAQVDESKKQLEIQFQIRTQSQVSGQTALSQNVVVSLEGRDQ